MRQVLIDDASYDAENEASTSAIRDFLYTYFDISLDCLPIGDWDRAELGSVDPFRYIDVEFVSEFGFRCPSEVAFLHEGAAVNLLCRIAYAEFVDDVSDSTVVEDFRSAVARGEADEALRVISPELQAIYRVYADGRVAAKAPSIHAAFRAWLSGDFAAFSAGLRAVREEVVIHVFANRGA